MKCLFLSSLLVVSMVAAPHLAAQSQANTPQVVHAFSDFGDFIGRSGFVKSTNPVVDEVFFSGSFSDHFWQALRFDPTTGNYVQAYVSPLAGASISRIAVGEVLPNPGDEIIVIRSTGLIQLHDQRNKELLIEFDTGVRSLTGFRAFDIDNDGQLEFAMAGQGGLHLFDTDASPLGVFPNLNGSDIVIGQMDQDAGWELAVSDGFVLDLDTGTVQCTWVPGFGFKMELSDFDNDGMDELVFAEYTRTIFAFDVDLCLPKWSMNTSYLDTIAIADTDGDGVEELLVGNAAPGKLHSHDLVTQALNWTIDNPMFGFTSINLLDADGDGQDEILWGAGIYSSAANKMYIVDAATHVTEWENTEHIGPFLGPLLGDVDGDGIDEVITASTESEGYQGGLAVVLEQENLNPIVSTALNFDDLEHISLHDLDGDGDMEILTTGEYNIEAYDVGPGGLITRIWDFSDSVGRPKFTCVEAGDIDGDGDIEIVMGAKGPPEVFVYDYATQALVHRSPVAGSHWTPVEQIELADVDADGQIEILARLEGDACYVLAADTTLEWTFAGDFWSMDVQKRGVGRPLRIYLGNATGGIDAHFWNLGTYQHLGGLSLLTTAVLGYQVVDASRILLSSAQSLQAYNLVNGALLWQGGDYGNDFGRRFEILDNGDIVTGGQHGIYSFGIR